MNHCIQCQHSWFPHQAKRPMKCPLCQSKNWDGNYLPKSKRPIDTNGAIGHNPGHGESPEGSPLQQMQAPLAGEESEFDS